MTGLHALHLVVLGLWGGVVLVELVFEVAAMNGYFPAAETAKLHRWTDRYVELPLLSLVVGSGLLLWSRLGWSAVLLPKILCGSAAVAANLVCVVFVEKRARAGVSERQTRNIFGTVVVGLPAALVAFFLGGQRAGWW